ncbi:TPA: hypothetical protein DDZ01_03650 [Candidatus Uhrbacteria bacterium]|nr:hypothetical protein [Candidatus Uhrbacteria bacterium]HCB55605.1 hypothetical protein [Candidatus Uhrbacteria bacterium]
MGKSEMFRNGGIIFSIRFIINKSCSMNNPKQEDLQEIKKQKAFFVFLAKTPVRIVLIVLVLLAFILGLTFAVYTKPISSPFVQRIVNILPYPAAFVNGQAIWMSDFIKEYEAITQYFGTLDDSEIPSDEVVKATIMDTLVNKIAVQHLANQYGVVLDESRVDEELASLLSTTTEEEFLAQLEEMFGWNLDEFKDRVLQPLVLAEQMSEFVETSEDLQAGQKEKAEAAYTRIINGEVFSDVATEIYSASGFEGDGDLGLVNTSDIPEEWMEVINAVEVGSVSPVTEFPGGYYLFSVVERTETEDGEQIHLYGLMIPQATLTEAVTHYIDSIKEWRIVGKEQAEE